MATKIFAANTDHFVYVTSVREDDPAAAPVTDAVVTISVQDSAGTQLGTGTATVVTPATTELNRYKFLVPRAWLPAAGQMITVLADIDDGAGRHTQYSDGFLIANAKADGS